MVNITDKVSDNEDSISTNIPSSLGTAGQVLTVNSGATAGEWADAAGGAYVLQSTTAITVAATTSVDFTFATGSNILAHRFVLNRISGSADGYEYQVQFRDQATSTFLTGTTDYEYVISWQRSTSATATRNNSSGANGIRLSINAGIAANESNFNGYVDVWNPFDTNYQLAQIQTVLVDHAGAAGSFYGSGMCNRNAGTGAAVDAIRFKPEGSGTFAATGSITYYTLEK